MAESIPPASDGSDALLPHEAEPRAAVPAWAVGALLFGRYRVLRELGRGGMGVVLLAHDEKLDQPLALKLVSDLVVNDARSIHDLRLEVLRGRDLTHTGIVRTYQFEHDDGMAAIVMEYVEGRTLSQLRALQPGRCFDPAEILPWLEQLCPALDYAHRHARIVHRDLKPANIMLTAAGQVKVADFGIASRLPDPQSGQTEATGKGGTARYMSPQQAQALAPSPLDDVYSLGATIYELLTSKPPFLGANILPQVLQAIPPPMAERRAEFGINDHAPIPPIWEEVVATCLAKEREDRPESAGEFLHRLKAPRLVPRPRAPRMPIVQPAPPRRSRWSLRVVSAVVVASAVAGVWLRENGSWFAEKFRALSPNHATPETATKERPFINSLGMEFVPVPGTKVLFCRWETRVRDYELFAKASSRESETYWETHEPMHPAANVSWDEATAFCTWLSGHEAGSGKIFAGHAYRLPTDNEWSCAIGIGDQENPAASPKSKNAKIANVYPWGTQWPPTPGAGNYIDESAKAVHPDWFVLAGYYDGFPGTSPVGSFPPNALGIYDLGGNIMEWCDNYFDSTQTGRVLRGACWNDWNRVEMHSSSRVSAPSSQHRNRNGFRVVLVLPGK